MDGNGQIDSVIDANSEYIYFLGSEKFTFPYNIYFLGNQSLYLARSTWLLILIKNIYLYIWLYGRKRIRLPVAYFSTTSE